MWRARLTSCSTRSSGFFSKSRASATISRTICGPRSRLCGSSSDGAFAAGSAQDLRAAAEGALGDLDHGLAIVTALLRNAEIESRRRRRGFTRVDLAQVCANVFELYEPLAEAKPVAFTLDAPAPLPVSGDFELLVEAIA